MGLGREVGDRCGWNPFPMDETYALVREAIAARRPIVATYADHRRELCPHVIGTKDGRAQVLCFQYGGSSGRGLPLGGEWRCLAIDRLTDVALTSGPWHTRGWNLQTQPCVDVVDLAVDLDAADEA